ncbi:MAG: hypothetical protein HY791_11240 [Deltaproteobacteria bacterium]|nr:hypothetical protein [Deltaproteobacteria bacterium]
MVPFAEESRLGARRGRWVCGAVCLVLLAGCGQLTLRLQTPELAGPSMVIGLVSENQVFSLSTSEPSWFDVPADESVRPEIFEYARTLEQLGLLRGALPASATGELLPLPANAYTAVIETDEAIWSRAEPTNTELSAFRSDFVPADRTGCRSFEGESFSLEITSASVRGIALGDDRALILAGEQVALYRYGSGIVSTARHSTCVADGFRTNQGAIVGDCSGTFWEVSVGADGEALTLTSSLSLSTSAPVLRADGDELGDEIFSMGRDGRVMRHDRAGSQEVGALPALGSANETLGDLRWTGPGGLSAVLVTSTAVLRVAGGQGRLVESGSEVGLVSIARVPGIGVVVADSESTFFVESKDSYERLGSASPPNWVLSIAPYEEAFVFGTQFGNLGQFVPAEGFCVTQRPVAFAIHDILPLNGGRLLLLGEASRNAYYAELAAKR